MLMRRGGERQGMVNSSKVYSPLYLEQIETLKGYNSSKGGKRKKGGLREQEIQKTSSSSDMGGRE